MANDTMEPMEIDPIENELEDKENFHHGNFVSKTPCTEKGYEELNVSELNMKLRYSITPASSPMSKSVTLNCTESKTYDRGDNCFNSSEPHNMSKSLNSTITVNDTLKPSKPLPLQPLPADHLAEGVKQVLRPLDSHLIMCTDVNNSLIPATVDDENVSLQSSSSSMINTPEATTPTKEMSKQEDGSPILRGLKSVLSMFRTSQSPVNNEKVHNADLSSPQTSSSTSCIGEDQKVIATTPISDHTLHSKVSPFRESIVFKDDLEKELQWKDDTTIIFSQERTPAHKLFPRLDLKLTNIATTIDKEETNILDSTTMSMDISLYYNDSFVGDVTMAENNTVTNISTAESDNEFVDCETTFKEDSVLENALTNNLTKTIDEIKEMKSERSGIVNESTLVVSQTAECEQSTSRVDTENKNMLNVKTEVTTCNSVSNEKEDIGIVVNPDCIEEFTKPENHIETTLKDPDVSSLPIHLNKALNKNINNSQAEISSIRCDQIVNSEHIVGSQASITPKEENTAVEHSENPDCIEEFTKLETHIERTLEGTDVSSLPVHLDKAQNKNINNSQAEISSIRCDQIVKSEHIVGSQASITPKKENTAVEHSENPDKDINVTINDDILPTVHTEFESALVKEENKDNFHVLNSNEAEEFGAKELAELELMNYVMSMTVQTASQENDTTINVISNIDTIVQGYNKDEVETLLNETLQDFSDNKLESEIPSKLHIDIQSEAEKLNITEDETNASADISDKQCVVIINNESISSCINESTSKTVRELMGNDVITNSKDMSEECKIGNLNETMQVNNLDETVESRNSIDIHDNKEIYKNQTSNTQLDSSEDPQASEKSLIDKTVVQNYSPVFEDLEVTINENDNVINFEDVDKLSNENDNVINFENVDKLSNENDNVINFENVDKLSLNAEEEIIVSENNSPYVSLSTNVGDVENKIAENFEETVNPKATESKMASPPISPKIQSKGYNFNFDEIDDPFATKTKIRMSPQPDDVNTTVNIEHKLEDKSKSSHKRKSLPKNQKDNMTHIVSVQNDDIKEGPNLVKAQGNEVIESKLDADPTQVIFTAPNFISVSSTTLDITNELDENKSKEDLLFDDQNSETFSSTTFNIITVKSNELEAQDLQENLNSTVLMSKDTDSNKISDDNSFLNLLKGNNFSASEQLEYFSAEPTFIKNATIINNVVNEKGDSLEGNKEESFIVTNNFDTFSSTTFNITTDVIVDQEHLHFVTKSAPVNEKVIFNTTTTFHNNPVENGSHRDKMILSDQSAYFSATPTSASSSSKNVFNIPEINETFTSSGTAAEMHQSITGVTTDPDNVLNCSNTYNAIATNNEDNAEDLNCTNSSKMTDNKNNTVREIKTDDDEIVREINTEDEDTLEGPFLEPEELNAIEQVPNSYNLKQDMMQFMDLNHAEIDENPEGGEIFIDAEAFEFLLNQNITNAVSDCGKESLFLKFDPLFAKRVSSAGVATSSPKNMQNTTNIDIKPSTSYEQIPKGSTSSQPLNINYSNDPLEEKHSEPTNSTTKPTMAVTPAVNSIVPKNQTSSPPISNRRSFTLTSPAIAVIDRLLSNSGNNSLIGQDNSVVHNEQHETEQNFSTQIRELLAEKELQFQTMKLESTKLRDRLSVLESQVDKLEKEGQARLSNINALNKELAERTKENRNMAAVVEEYERTIASLIAERSQEKKQRDEERKQLIQERDEQIAHLTNMECSFNDLHSKYEKSKQIIIGFKTNEDAYKKTLKDFEENLAKMQNNYELLKQHATSKLNHANQELEKMNKAHASEVLKLKAMFKRKELDIKSLEESLAQKTKANDELTAICDELINKVG